MNEPPGGWPLRMAITDLVTEQWQVQADALRQLAPTERGNEFDSMRRLIWDDIRAQLLYGRLVAKGIPDGGRTSENIDPHFFSEATADFREGSVTLGKFKFIGVRITRAQTPAQGDGLPAYSSGVAGRPTSIQLCQGEMQARHRRGGMLPTITAEAEALSEWLKRAHPNAAPATGKTIRNSLGAEFRQLKRPK